jgi:uncharacterized membrane protein YfcA
VAAGVIASVSGFGIGSVLTPLVSTVVDTKLAVAFVSIPHFIGTFIRLLRMYRHINRPLALSFGAASAIGGLIGALLNAYFEGPIFGYVLGVLLVFAGLSGLTGLADRFELKGTWKWIGGFASAGFGGLVGNQGGIRSAAMLGFDLPKESFVATATAIAIVVDTARLPVYVATQYEGIVSLWPNLLISTAGVIAGTLAGFRLLHRIDERIFKRVVAVLVFALGIFMLLRTSA